MSVGICLHDHTDLCGWGLVAKQRNVAFYRGEVNRGQSTHGDQLTGLSVFEQCLEHVDARHYADEMTFVIDNGQAVVAVLGD